MSTENRTLIPVSHKDQYLSKVKYPNHRPGDERVVVFVRPEHTTKKDS